MGPLPKNVWARLFWWEELVLTGNLWELVSVYVRLVITRLCKEQNYIIHHLMLIYYSVKTLQILQVSINYSC